MSPVALPLSHDTGSVISGLSTTAELERGEAPRGLSVNWIAWSSPFRATGLRIGDRITHLNGEALEPRMAPNKFQGLPGQPGESYEWEKRGAKAGDALRFKIWRPDGEVEIEAKLVPELMYQDAEGRSALAPGGPAALESDGFSGTWSIWYEKLVWKMTQILDGSWERATLNTRSELVEMLSQGERIEMLRKKYPGDFAEGTYGDWQRTVESLRGKKLDTVDLSYRELGAKRLERAKQASAEAWEALKKEGAEKLVPTFPAPDIHARAEVSGRWVELPWITPSTMVNDLGQTWAVADGGSDGAYVVRLSESPEYLAFYRALFRFGTLVQPGTRERYQFMAEILPMPAMITFRDRPLTAHQVRLVAGRAGEDGEFFVDLRKAEPVFASESEMTAIGASALKDDASPTEVLDFMVAAIKRADEKAFRDVFATWEAGLYDGGRPSFLPLRIPSTGEWNSAWEAARRVIMKDVYDVRVDRVSAVRRLFDADAKVGVPSVDQVVAYYDIFGRFDDEYRSFNHFTVHRRRVLQRIANGPWRIVEVQGI
jgi:Type II secretory pathway, component PulC